MKRYFIFALIVMSMAGCRTQKDVQPVITPQITRDTIYLSSDRQDSIYVHDSIYIQQKGDTIYQKEYHTRWRDRILTDTIYRSQVDTVTQVQTVEVEKQVRYIPVWAKVLSAIGIIALIAIGLLIYRRT